MVVQRGGAMGMLRTTEATLDLQCLRTETEDVNLRRMHSVLGLTRSVNAATPTIIETADATTTELDLQNLLVL